MDGKVAVIPQRSGEGTISREVSSAELFAAAVESSEGKSGAVVVGANSERYIVSIAGTISQWVLGYVRSLLSFIWYS